MTNNQFIENAMRTNAPNLAAQARLADYPISQLDMLHAAMGLSTESGELLDAFKKHIFYGKPLDRVNIKEEIGDTLWYVALMCSSMGISIEHCMELVIAKLKARYPEKFTSENAIVRDLDRERAVLEEKV